MVPRKALVIGLIGLLSLVACDRAPATPTAVARQARAAVPTSPPTAVPTRTAAPTAAATAALAPEPTAGVSPSPVARPEADVSVVVSDAETGEPVRMATVRLVNRAAGYNALRFTDAAGQALFERVPVADEPFEFAVSAAQYESASTTVVVVEGSNDLSAELAPAAEAVPTSAPVSLPAAPPPPPPPAAQPAGPNLLQNPGFESGSAGWLSGSFFAVQTIETGDYPQFVRSGQRAAYQAGPSTAYAYTQSVPVTSGQTYRFTVWGRAWSSSHQDRTASVNPGNITLYVCINANDENQLSAPTTYCSGIGRPLDTWQQFSVDAVAIQGQIKVFLVMYFNRDQSPLFNEAVWDDAYLGLAPASATPAPPPPTYVLGPRPEPVPFAAAALRDSMAGLQTMIEQLGGLLDRLYNGEGGTCQEFWNYYAQANATATYHSLPFEWQGIYDDYIWATDNVVATNEPIASLCQHGGGRLTALNYGVARTGVNDSLDRLIPAIAGANALLGQ